MGAVIHPVGSRNPLRARCGVFLLAFFCLGTSSAEAGRSSARLQATLQEAPDGDPIRGAALAASRSQGLCILCHRIPGVQEHEVATIGPDLTGLAARLDSSLRRERLLYPERFNPETVMPSYNRSRHPGHRVMSGRQDQPLLDAQGLADILAWMSTLK